MSHLQIANQTYFQHFKDSMKYCYISMSCAFYFFCHAIHPDIYVDSGSKTIKELYQILNKKVKLEDESIYAE
jgi:hypothetical protein